MITTFVLNIMSTINMKPGGMMVKKVNVEGLGNPVHGEYVRSEVWKLI